MKSLKTLLPPPKLFTAVDVAVVVVGLLLLWLLLAAVGLTGLNWLLYCRNWLNAICCCCCCWLFMARFNVCSSLFWSRAEVDDDEDEEDEDDEDEDDEDEDDWGFDVGLDEYSSWSRLKCLRTSRTELDWHWPSKSNGLFILGGGVMSIGWFNICLNID